MTLKPTHLILLFSLFVSQSVYAYNPTLEPFFQDVHLPYKLISKVINTDNCYSSEEIFLRCMYGLNEGLALSKKPRLIYSAKRIHEFGLAATPSLKEWMGPIFLAQLSVRQDQLSDRERVLNYKAEIREETQSYRELYASRYQERVDINRLVKYIRVHTLNPQNEAYVTASIMMGFMQTTDTHYTIYPKSYFSDDTQMSSATNPLPPPRGSLGVRAEPEHDRDKKVHFVRVLTAFPGEPAWNSGIRNNDLITQINGVAVEKLSDDAIINFFHGPVDSKIKLRILRKERVLNFTVTLKYIEPSVTDNDLFYDRNHKWGYVGLPSFMSKESCNDVSKSVTKLQSLNVDGLILDLRNNPGGRIDMAGCIINLFYGPSENLFETHNIVTGDITVFSGKEKPITDLPLVILVNSQTASASELTAGALQDFKRAFILGEQTYGKGTVQEVDSNTIDFWNFKSDELRVFKTKNTYHLPLGRTPHMSGISPDFVVYSLPNPTFEQMSGDPRETDLYYLNLPISPQYSQSQRLPEIQTLNECIGKTGLAPTKYENTKDYYTLDYQAFFAEDLLNCIVK